MPARPNAGWPANKIILAHCPVSTVYSKALCPAMLSPDRTQSTAFRAILPDFVGTPKCRS
jgi:hypothetical protein